MRPHFCLGAFALAATTAFASVTTSVDMLDPSDGGTQPPAGIMAVDVFVDASSDDVWTATGLRGLVTPAGQALNVSIRYVGNDDDNTPTDDRLFNPGTDDRFGTFFTKPRLRDTIGRYQNAGAAVAGRYSPTGPLATSTDTEINIAYFASPPENANSPSFDGYIARISLNVADVQALPDFVNLQVGAPGAATGPIIFQSTTEEGSAGTVSSSFRNPQISGVDWAVWYNVPEPMSLALIALGGFVALRRR